VVPGGGIGPQQGESFLRFYWKNIFKIFFSVITGPEKLEFT
jgi:hypothetical protein